MKRIAERYGPWAVVTGASDGIGQQFARCLAAEGLNLVLVARRRGRLEALADALRAQHGVAVDVIAADLTAPEGLAAVLDGTTAREVGLFVASAGFGTSGPFLDTPVAEELSMLDVNCRAVIALTHAFARAMARRKRGGVVLMSSLLAFQGVPRAAGYAASKAWVQSFAEGLRPELAAHGVDVIAAAPGPIHSGFAARASMTMAMAQTPDAVAAATLEALGQWGTVRPGWLSKLLEASLALLPRWGRVWVMARVMAGMTRGARVP